MEDEEHPKAKVPGICGVTTFTEHIEWICVRSVHGDVYQRKTGDRTHNKGDMIFSTSPKADQHHFVNRWPNRPINKE